jgi:hypothetical protein
VGALKLRPSRHDRSRRNCEVSSTGPHALDGLAAIVAVLTPQLLITSFFNILLVLIATHVRQSDRAMISGVRLNHPGAAPAMEIPSWRRTAVGIVLAAVATWATAVGFWT